MRSASATSKSQPYLSLESVSFGASGKSLSLSVAAGDRYALFGRTGSGLEELVAVAVKKASPQLGKAIHHGKTSLVSTVTMVPRSTPASLAKADGTTRAAGVLGLLGLWEDRNTLCSKMGWRQIAACRLIGPLLASEGLWVIDGELDAVDLRVAEDFCAEIAEPRESGKG
ncbi:MAG: hypothetical protein ABUL72_00480, partial [Armatimonadota bacterium]